MAGKSLDESYAGRRLTPKLQAARHRRIARQPERNVSKSGCVGLVPGPRFYGKGTAAQNGDPFCLSGVPPGMAGLPPATARAAGPPF